MDQHYCVIYGRLDPGALGALATAIDSAQVIAPPEQIIVSVLEQDRPWWLRIVAKSGVVVVEEPLDRGTGISVLAGLKEVVARAPTADVSLFDLARASERSFFGPVVELLGFYQATHPRTLHRFLGELEQGGSLDEIYPFCTELDLARDVLMAGAAQLAFHPESTRPTLAS